MNAGQLLFKVEHLVYFNIFILLRLFLNLLSGLDFMCFLVRFARLLLCFRRGQNEITPVFGLCRCLRYRHCLEFLFHRGDFCLLLFDLLSGFRQSVRVDAARAESARTFLEEIITLLQLRPCGEIVAIILRLIFRLIEGNFLLFSRVLRTSGACLHRLCGSI